MAITQILHDSGILELVIDIPPVNAVDIAHLNELTDIVNSVNTRPEVHAIVLRSEGKGFVGGGDVKRSSGLMATRASSGRLRVRARCR